MAELKILNAVDFGFVSRASDCYILNWANYCCSPRILSSWTQGDGRCLIIVLDSILEH